jgi:hypothetical protein
MAQAYIVGRKTDRAVMHRSGTYEPAAPPAATCLDHAINQLRLAGVQADYEILYIDDQAALRRLANGDACNVTYTAGATVPTLDFAPEDALLLLRTSSSSLFVNADGLDTVTLTFTLVDGNGVTQAVTGVQRVLCASPSGPFLLAVTFANGVGTVIFKTRAAGSWQFPVSVRQNGTNFKADPAFITVVQAVQTAF